MAEWASYALSDFLLFSEATYWRLFERANAAFWPLPLAMLALGAGAVLAAWRGTLRLAYAVLALAWAWSGWQFMQGLYAPVNWVASYLWPFFIFQAALMLWLAFVPPAPSHGAVRRMGLAVVLYALALHPLTTLFERDLASAEVFGIAPDPTAFMTLGVLFLSIRSWRGSVAGILAVLWCAASALTLYTMGVWIWIIPASFAALDVAVVLHYRDASGNE